MIGATSRVVFDVWIPSFASYTLRHISEHRQHESHMLARSHLPTRRHVGYVFRLGNWGGELDIDGNTAINTFVLDTRNSCGCPGPSIPVNSDNYRTMVSLSSGSQASFLPIVFRLEILRWVMMVPIHPDWSFEHLSDAPKAQLCFIWASYLSSASSESSKSSQLVERSVRPHNHECNSPVGSSEYFWVFKNQWDGCKTYVFKNRTSR